MCIALNFHTAATDESAGGIQVPVRNCWTLQLLRHCTDWTLALPAAPSNAPQNTRADSTSEIRQCIIFMWSAPSVQWRFLSLFVHYSSICIWILFKHLTLVSANVTWVGHNERGEPSRPTTAHRWTGSVWEITGTNSRFQENYLQI